MDRQREKWISGRGSGVLIQGNFKPPLLLLYLKRLEWGVLIMLALLLLVFLVLYTLTIHVESDIKRITQETRQMDEVNKTLQTELNRLQSFEKIKNLATQVPDLHRAEEMIEINTPVTDTLPSDLPQRTGQAPHMSGY